MLTFVEAVSLAGDRAKQNDDACGFRGPHAWVIDGATDVVEAPLTDAASDASWLAHRANTFFQSHNATPRTLIRAASIEARTAFPTEAATERWQLPTASLLMIEAGDEGVTGYDLGDCRLFALDAAAQAHALGGPRRGVSREGADAADAAKRAGAFVVDQDAQSRMRAQRANHNMLGHYAVFGLQPECADRARMWSVTLARPAHLLLATDGFGALIDRYDAYDAASLVRAALTEGLHTLAQRLRAIEAEDGAGAHHPRWKRSDDATALLMRLT